MLKRPGSVYIDVLKPIMVDAFVNSASWVLHSACTSWQRPEGNPLVCLNPESAKQQLIMMTTDLKLFKYFSMMIISMSKDSIESASNILKVFDGSLWHRNPIRRHTPVRAGEAHVHVTPYVTLKGRTLDYSTMWWYHPGYE